MSWEAVAEKLEQGLTVQLRPKGNSMTPKIKSGELVILRPFDRPVRTGDIVLAHLGGRRWYLHLVLNIDNEGRCLIGNNHGRVNGIAKKVYGRVWVIGDRLLR